MGGISPRMGDPWEVSHQVARNKSVRYTLVKYRGKADNIVVEVGGVLQIVSEPLMCRSGYGQTSSRTMSPKEGVCNTLGISHIGRGQE